AKTRTWLVQRLSGRGEPREGCEGDRSSRDVGGTPGERLESPQETGVRRASEHRVVTFVEQSENRRRILLEGRFESRQEFVRSALREARKEGRERGPQTPVLVGGL